ncbi:hypothetical protein Zmor_004880 [Zophobas morio]|uniref:Uncharacterized protein n=1 Tax=Zophobas morio TaxID=2755281 RepID=A0AA38IU98_9CUCU|nr:hypothetical protein Zmor_004880 [Zophobas morio]
MLDEEKWRRASGVVDHRRLRSVSDFKTSPTPAMNSAGSNLPVALDLPCVADAIRQILQLTSPINHDKLASFKRNPTLLSIDCICVSLIKL